MGYPTRVQLIKRKARSSGTSTSPRRWRGRWSLSEVSWWRDHRGQEPAGAKKDRGATAPAQKNRLRAPRLFPGLWEQGEAASARTGSRGGQKGSP